MGSVIVRELLSHSDSDPLQGWVAVLIPETQEDLDEIEGLVVPEIATALEVSHRTVFRYLAQVHTSP